MDVKDVARFLAENAGEIGRDVAGHLQELAGSIDEKTGVEGLGQNITLNAVSFAFDILMSNLASKTTGRPALELFKEISYKHQRCIQELMSEYSGKKISIMVDLSGGNSPPKEG